MNDKVSNLPWADGVVEDIPTNAQCTSVRCSCRDWVSSKVVMGLVYVPTPKRIDIFIVKAIRST